MGLLGTPGDEIYEIDVEKYYDEIEYWVLYIDGVRMTFNKDYCDFDEGNMTASIPMWLAKNQGLLD